MSPRDREIQVEYTVNNPSKHEFKMVYLPLPEFVRSLCVEDEDGRSLNFLPNWMVDQAKEELKKTDPKGYETFVHRFKQDKYAVAVLLPADAPFRPESVRTIRFRYQAHDPVRHYPLIGRLSEAPRDMKWSKRAARQWTSRLFSIPYIEIATTRFPGHDYDHFFVVEGTPELSTWASGQIEGNKPTKNIHENGFDDDSRVISVRLPAADRGPYRWSMQYDQRPVSKSRLGILSLYLISMVIASLVGWYANYHGNWLGMSSPGVTGGLATGMLGVLLTLDKPWEDRYRMLLVPPLVSEAALFGLKLAG